MSWLPAVARDDRVVLGFLSVVAVGTVYIMHELLTAYRDEAEIKATQPKTQYITQETEDALKYGTLETLLGHYNWAIRDTACKIVCERAANDGTTLDVLLWGITRPDYDERMKNLRALAFITDQNTLHLLHYEKAYSALVRSLELCLPTERKPEDKLNDESYDEYYLRDMAEKLCLMFISQLLNRYEAKGLVKAKFVEKWLAKQYWGDTPDEITANFSQYMEARDNRVNEIVKHINRCRRGREALVRTGLITQATREIIEGQAAQLRRRLSYVLPIYAATEDGDENADRPVGIRPQEQSAEEQRLRHRHREAMVFNDGSRPLNSEDIIQRDHGSPTLVPSQAGTATARELEEVGETDT